jgi:pimeloyl-ACP methyl ester carboxylesterase
MKKCRVRDQPDCGPQPFFIVLRMHRHLMLALLPLLAWLCAVPVAAQTIAPGDIAEEVRIPAGAGVQLAGTLRLPNGKDQAPFPAVILIAGSGQNGRGGFDLLIHRLLASGITTLEYDKRGVGQSTGAFADVLPLLADDAEAAFAFLSRHPMIDRNRIALLGHSQGGIIAPAVAARNEAVAAVVLLAGSAKPGAEFKLQQFGDQLRTYGVAEPAIERQQSALRRLLDAQTGGADAPTTAALRAALKEGFVADQLGTHSDAEQLLAIVESEATLSSWKARPGLMLARCASLSWRCSLNWTRRCRRRATHWPRKRRCVTIRTQR